MTVSDNRRRWIAGIGELLWDLFPGGAQLGGTISNFAVMAARLGDHAICASRLGDDDLGRRARERLRDLPVDTSFLQMDPSYPTGSVSVALEDGQPRYVIHSPVAWDFLELTPQWLDLAGRVEAVSFGTLAQRQPASRHTIEGFLAATSPACVRILDVNLRPPFYSAEVIERSLERATLLKMNDAEMPILLESLGFSREDPSSDALLAGARKLLGSFPIELVCVTMGKSGSLLVTRRDADRHPGIPIEVVDAVGAGDAFTAALTHSYLRGASLAALNEAGNRWGSWVASRPGAMPELDPATVDLMQVRRSIV